MGGIRCEGHPFRVFAEIECGGWRSGWRSGGRRRRASGRRLWIADLELQLLVAAHALEDDLGIPFTRREPIAEPLTVVRDRGRANRLPRDDVFELDGSLRGR